MREIHEPASLLRVIRAKCIDCSGGSEAEVRKCTAIACALWPYRMATNPFRAPREMTEEPREETARRLAAGRARRAVPDGIWPAEPFNLNAKKRTNGPGRTFGAPRPESAPVP
jgi:hypothetical protein